MNKTEYLKELAQLLKKIPENERKDILYDYQEHFEVGTDEGKSEEDIIKDLGSPKVIARELLAHYHIEYARSNTSFTTVLRAIFATMAIGFFNLVFLLAPFLAIIGFMIALYITSIALIVSAVMILLADPLNSFLGAEYIHLGFEGAQKWSVKILGSVILSGLGVLLGIGTIYLSKGLYKITLKYLHFNLKMIKPS